MLDHDRLRAALADACEDANLRAASFVVFVVTAARPPGTTPIAYLQPAGLVLPDTVAVFRAAGAEQVARHKLTAHRLAIWARLPGLPESALGPMLRHELEHARRWEQSGTSFFEADELLRASVLKNGGAGYGSLPSELEANAAAAAYAAGRLTPRERAELTASPDCAALLASATPPGDVVDATLAALARRSDWRPELSRTERDAYLGDVRRACASWDPSRAAELGSDRNEPEVVTVLPGSWQGTPSRRFPAL